MLVSRYAMLMLMLKCKCKCNVHALGQVPMRYAEQ
jgi:hypothetical protein